MAYPYINAMNAKGRIIGIAPTGPGILAGNYPLFDVSAPVDSSGMELAFVSQVDNSTVGSQAMATGTTTVVLKPYDAATTAQGATTATPLFAKTDFSNSATGANSWTGSHNAMKGVGTTTTDLDADDWVNVEVANITGTAGFGVIGWTAFFVHGVPGSVA